MDGQRTVAITGGPSEAEAAAIVAAIEALWPRPATGPATPAVAPTAWRFSGRWWATNGVMRRPRPGR